MRRTIVLTFVAAALLIVAGVALNSYGREIFEGERAAAGGLPRFSMDECYGCGMMESWEKAAGVAWLLALSLFIAGVKLSADEPRPPHRVSMLGLRAGPSRRRAFRAASPAKSAAVVNVRPHATRPASLHGDDGLTPLERVIRGS
jgi:hypothetical protein